MFTFGLHSGVMSGIIFVLPHYPPSTLWHFLIIATSNNHLFTWPQFFFSIYFSFFTSPAAVSLLLCCSSTICCRKIDDGVINQKWSGVEEPRRGSPRKPPWPLFPMGPSVFNKLTISTGSEFLDHMWQSFTLLFSLSSPLFPQLKELIMIK